MAKTRICMTCRSEYKYCPHCSNTDQPAWMVNFDTEACKELFNAVSGYNMGVITKEQVKEVIDKYQITDFSKYKESIRNVLNTLFPAKKAVEEPKVLDVELKSEVEEPTATEETEEEVPKRRYSAKRRGDIQD